MSSMHERYRHNKIEQVWSEENKYKWWKDIEIEHLKAIATAPPYIELDIPAIKEIEKETKHDVAAFVKWMEYALKDAGYEHSNKVHYGLTSSDIVDTTFSLQLRQVTNLISLDLNELQQAINNLSNNHKTVVLIGRTHGQAGELITLSHKLSEWQNSISWYLGSAYGHPFVGKMSGSMGDSKYNSDATQRIVLNNFGLQTIGPIQGQVISRAYHAKFMNDWSILAGIIEKISLDIRLHAQTGIDEFHEKFTAKQIGSSSMPHKHNPWQSENLTGIARTIRGYASTALQNIALWDERDMSHSSAERIIFPDASVLLGFQITKLTEIIRGLVIDEEAIKANIEKSRVLLESQMKLLEAVKSGQSRAEAHENIKYHTKIINDQSETQN